MLLPSIATCLLVGLLPLCRAALLEHIPTCHEIARSLSPFSDVYFAGHYRYVRGIKHWASSSSQLSACVVEAGTVQDIGVILKIVGRTRTPFAVKGGGHSSNPGASSTEGVHISMYRFSNVTYNSASQTAEISPGLVWDDVYEALEPHNVNVVGGRVTGVGVAGFILGGGYSWLTNQYGLSVDTVVAYELVKPSGDVVTVTKESDSELFFGLKGGMNNFGIVTKFVLKAFPQTKVWGGLIIYGLSSYPEVTAATAAFSATETDPKASIITSYQTFAGVPTVGVLVFYDGPTPPAGIFDGFNAIPHLTRDVKTRSFTSLVKAFPVWITSGQRAIFHTASVLGYGPDFLQSIVNETLSWGSVLPIGTGVLVSYAMEPFLPSIYSHNPDPTAFPFSRSAPISPLNVYFSWILPSHDQLFHGAMRRTIENIQSAAIRYGSSSIEAPLYPNYAMVDTPASRIWGPNLPALRSLKARIDPDSVMNLAGGFKV